MVFLEKARWSAEHANRVTLKVEDFQITKHMLRWHLALERND